MALDPDTGDRLWTRHVSDRLYFGVTVDRDADGDHLWTYPAGEGNAPIPSPVVRDGGVCVVGDGSAFELSERGW